MNNKEQGERMAKIETDIAWIKSTNVQQNKDFKELKQIMTSFVETAPEKFACKETEKKVEKISLTLAKWSGITITIIALINLVFAYLKI